MDCPSQHDMKKLIMEFRSHDENLFISVEIGSGCVPIVILDIWAVHLQLWDLQNLWKDSCRQVESLIMWCPSQWSTIKMAQHRLTSCQWNEEIQGFSGLGRGAIGGLICYLSTSCLITIDIIHHIEILQSNLEMMMRLISSLGIQHFTGCASKGKAGLAMYKCLPAYKGLHHLGSELVSGIVTHFGGIFTPTNTIGLCS